MITHHRPSRCDIVTPRFPFSESSSSPFVRLLLRDERRARTEGEASLRVARRGESSFSLAPSLVRVISSLVVVSPTCSRLLVSPSRLAVHSIATHASRKPSQYCNPTAQVDRLVVLVYIFIYYFFLLLAVLLKFSNQYLRYSL